MPKPFVQFALMAAAGLLCSRLAAQPWDPAMKPGTSLTATYPTGLGPLGSVSLDLSTIMNTDYHRLGWQYNLFSMHIPLAWNITKGNREIVVDIADGEFPTGLDDQGQPDPNNPISDFIVNPGHPDVPWRKFGATPGGADDGNFLWISSEYRTLAEPLATQGNGNGSIDSRLIGKNQHGFSAISMAVAKDNSTGIVGIAPECSAIATYHWDNPWQIDTDGSSANNMLRVPDVTGCTYVGSGFSTETAVMNGIIVVAGSGNALSEPYVSHTTEPHAVGCNGFAGDKWIKVAPSDILPARKIFNNIPGKVIAVGIVKDGVVQDNTLCRKYFDGSGMRFSDQDNYAPEGPKFTTSGGFYEHGFMDLVVPENEVVASFKSFSKTTGYDMSEKYRHGDGATSRAVGQLSGVVALMRSVDLYLGVTITDPNDKSAIHRKAYDILTFTARKIQDQQQRTELSRTVTTHENGVDVTRLYVFPGHPCWDTGETFFLPSLHAPESVLKNPDLQYVLQTSDNLKRTWAQRMGFGMVDAYRAVAHSIPAKAAYTYQQSVSLTGGHSINGRNYIHFGSKINEQLDLGSEDRNNNGQTNNELNVLEWGGADLPGEEHNNQGVTRIEGTNQTITVTVPQNYVAAIDGIVRTANSSTGRTIETVAASGPTNDHGLILASGMLDGVNLKGRVKAGDLLVNPVSNNATGITVQNHGGTSDLASRVGSEIFGVVTLKKNAALIVDNNATLTLQPGAVVDMQGTQNITVKNGATLVMEYPSTIKGGASRRLVVENGGKVIIRSKPSAEKLWKTELLTRVEVQDGGQLIAEENAFYKVNFVDIKTGGTWNCQKGSHTVLGTGGHMLGKWYVQGDAGQEATVSGELDACGTTTGTASITALGVWLASAPYDLTKKKISFNRANFDNVRIYARNMNVDPILDCRFRSDRAIFGKREMLRLDFSGTATAAALMPTVSTVEVKGCTFLDRQGDIDKNEWRGDDKYHVTGLVVRGMRNVTVENSHFNSLMHSINSYRCNRVLVKGNNFHLANAAVHDEGSAVTFCNNICRKTEFTNGYNFSRAGITVDNDYDTVSSSVFAISTAQQFIRGNIIKDFREGAYSGNSPFIMNPYAPMDVACPWGNGTPVYLNGYNDFISDAANHIPSEYLAWNLGGTARLGNQQADLAFEPNSIIQVYEGYNKFSLRSGNHLVNRNLPINTVYVSYNEWQDPGGVQVRHDNTMVNAVGSILNLQDDPPQKTCGILNSCRPPGYPIFCAGDQYPNDGTWTEKASTDPYLNNAYVHARTRMMDYMVDPLCRRIKAHDALQAAVLGTSTESKLYTLATDYSMLANDPASPVVLRTTALMLKGEAHERLNQPDSALAAYSTITTVYSTSPDSMSAAWRIQYIGAEQADTTFGITYDASMSSWRERVLEDMRRKAGYPAPGSHKQGGDDEQIAVTGLPSETRLEQNAPNPFGEETQIGYTIGRAGHVRLIVSDVTGRTISVLVDRAQEAGQYSIPLSAAGLTTGVYWYHLEVNGAIISRQMTVIR